VLFAIALYFFEVEVSDKTLTPAKSRQLNADCVFLDYFDLHDLWHLMSAAAMFMLISFVIHANPPKFSPLAPGMFAALQLHTHHLQIQRKEDQLHALEAEAETTDPAMREKLLHHIRQFQDALKRLGAASTVRQAVHPDFRSASEPIAASTTSGPQQAEPFFADSHRACSHHWHSRYLDGNTPTLGALEMKTIDTCIESILVL